MDASAQHYLREYRYFTQVQNGTVTWQLRKAELPHQPWLAALDKYLQDQFGVDEVCTIIDKAEDFEYWLQRLEFDLYADLEALCPKVYRPILSRSAVGLMSIVNANAFAKETPGAPNTYVIGVHLGLVWLNFLLGEALLTASTGHSVEAFAVYQRARLGYQQKRIPQALAYWWNKLRVESVPEQAHSAAVGTVALRFTALHELGHVVLGHVDMAGMHVSDFGEVAYQNYEKLGTTTMHAMEFAADRFALHCMIENRGSDEIMWNNLLFINAQFRFFAHIERYGVDDRHPHPEARISALTEELIKCIGPPPNDAQTWAEQTMQEWRDAKA